MGKLTTLKVKNASPGRHSDGDGLLLLVKESGARSWVLRIQAGGVRRDFGLGSVDLSTRSPAAAAEAERIPILQRKMLNLAEAREKAETYRRMTKAGIDPVEERRKAMVRVPTFKKAAEDCHEALKKGWRNKRHTDSWLACLEAYAFPSIGAKAVDQVEGPAVRDLLAPIWMEKPETARRVLQRIGAVLDFAHVQSWRASETSLKSVRKGLPRQPKIERHFPAMPYADVPDFVTELRGQTETVGRLALIFLIATAARSGEVRNARWSHIDREAKLWHRPAPLMKAGVAHTVTLNQLALDILDRAQHLRSDEKDPLLFPGVRNRVLSDMTLLKILRDADQPYTPHGFRSSFRDFAAEKMPTIPDPVAESALAHAVPDKTIAAYKRTQFLELRRKLLDGWGDFLTGTGKVVRLARSA